MSQTMKKNHRWVAGVCACSLLLALACATPLWADRDAPGNPPDQVAKNADASICYEGPGHVVILNNGWVFMEKGREGGFVDEHGEWHWTTTSELLNLKFDMVDLTLVDHNGELFLDRAGKQMEARGLSWQQVDATRFEEVEQLPEGCGMFSVVSITGDVTLNYDGASGEVKLTICAEETEDAPAQDLTFSAHRTGQCTTPTAPTLGDDGPGCQSPVCRSGASCSFSGVCRLPKVAVCYCDGVDPECGCKKLPDNNHEIGPEPISKP